jgi:hypothetical protein
VAVVLAPSAPSAQSAQSAGPSDLDTFMEQVIARRDENWKKLQQYVLEEREVFQLTGPDGSRLYGFDRDYTWFIRQGFFIRSPLKADGVRISEEERAREEEAWIKRERAREERRLKRTGVSVSIPGGVKVEETIEPAPETPQTVEDVLKQSVEPRFVSAAYFLRFKFDPGHYALAGRERMLDRDVLRIEYYPSKLFTEGRSRPNKKVRDKDEEIEEKMNKVSLVTLWVDPKAHQIIQYTFANMDFDFLPGRSIVRVDDLKASMRMSQPFPDVWLPATIEMHVGMMTALGSIAGTYDVTYHDYRLAEVTTRIKP